MRAPLLLSGLLTFAACDYSGDWLYSNATDAPGIIDLGTLVPADVNNAADVAAATYYGEVGSTGTSQQGGVTFTFNGTGAAVCLWVDPELVFWNESVSILNPTDSFAAPDNIQDDGDIDLFAGYSVYYSGSPGEEVGSFEIRYQDALGNVVPVDLNECTIASGQAASGGHSGRGRPEHCTLRATQPGVEYLVLLQTWSTPLDDDKLSYAMALTNGSCDDLAGTALGLDDECVLRGEARASGEDAPIPGSEDFELAFCDAVQGGSGLVDYCLEEADKDCDEEPCFCAAPE